MAEGIELAKAYVQIIPSTKGFEGKLESEMESAGGSSANTFAKGFGGAGKAMGAIAATAVAAASAAAVKLAKDAVSSYANYEQLVGGVEKLYGSAADKLMDFADAAYATAGMSANSYMETATSFSAALINSLGGDVDKAADMTDVAMRAISDNVNVFGSDMGSVTNAFQGFAKQNYTMLDNLKLGYGGTKEEMQRLIDDANEYRLSLGQTADLSIKSFADVVTAIQSVQEKQNIAGTTAKEAMFTIEGAVKATKSAWANVITAIGRGEGIEDAMSSLTTSLFGGENGGGLLAQIIPRIQTVLQGIAGFITQAAPIIAEQLPIIFETLLPPLLSAVTNIIIALIPAIIETLPVLIGALVEAIPELLTAIGEALVVIWNNWVGPALEAIGTFLSDIWQGIVEFFTRAMNWINERVIAPVKNFFTGLWNKLREGAAAAWEGIKNIWNVVSGWFTEKIVDPIKNFFTGMWDGLKEGASKAWEGIKNVFQPVVDWFKNVFKKAWEGVKNVFSTGGKIFSGIKEGLEKVFKTVVNAIIRGLNTIIAAPFDTINWIFGKLRGINILGVSPFSWLGSLTVPKIPELAKGGILTGPTLMLGGEDGSEAVIPLERNTEWIRAVAVEMDEATDNSEVDVLEDILEKLDNMRIYLDTGKLVGGISGRMDGALGDNAGMKQRGVALA